MHCPAGAIKAGTDGPENQGYHSVKRFSFIGDGLSHVAFGAIAIASVLKLSNNMLIVLPITILSAILLAVLGILCFVALNEAMNGLELQARIARMEKEAQAVETDIASYIENEGK